MRSLASIAFFLMGAGVALGAFGAHGLRDFFIGREEEIWKTAVFYQLIHALSLLSLVLFERQQFLTSKLIERIGYAITGGVLIFSGSLYLLVLTREKWLGAVTPIGGTLLIASWIVLGFKMMQRTQNLRQ